MCPAPAWDTPPVKVGGITLGTALPDDCRPGAPLSCNCTTVKYVSVVRTSNGKGWGYGRGGRGQRMRKEGMTMRGGGGTISGEEGVVRGGERGEWGRKGWMGRWKRGGGGGGGRRGSMTMGSPLHATCLDAIHKQLHAHQIDTQQSSSVMQLHHSRLPVWD